MGSVEQILSKIEAGVKVRIVQDHYGQEKVEVPRGWILFRRQYNVSRDEMTQVKAALSNRSRGGSARTAGVVKI